MSSGAARHTASSSHHGGAEAHCWSPPGSIHHATHQTALPPGVKRVGGGFVTVPVIQQSGGCGTPSRRGSPSSSRPTSPLQPLPGALSQDGTTDHRHHAKEHPQTTHFVGSPPRPCRDPPVRPEDLYDRLELAEAEEATPTPEQERERGEQQAPSAAATAPPPLALMTLTEEEAAASVQAQPAATAAPAASCSALALLLKTSEEGWAASARAAARVLAVVAAPTGNFVRQLPRVPTTTLSTPHEQVAAAAAAVGAVGAAAALAKLLAQRLCLSSARASRPPASSAGSVACSGACSMQRAAGASGGGGDARRCPVVEQGGEGGRRWR